MYSVVYCGKSEGAPAVKIYPSQSGSDERQARRRVCSPKEYTWHVVPVAPPFLSLSIILACGCLGMLFGQRLSVSSSIPSDGDIRDSLREFHRRL